MSNSYPKQREHACQHFETIRRGIRRAREDDVPIAPQPADRNFVIPPEYTTMENGDLYNVIVTTMKEY